MPGTLRFLNLSHLFYGIICVNIFIMKSVYFKELHNEQEYYSSTIYRAGAAECQLLLVIYIVIVYCYCYCVSHNLEMILGHPALPLNNNVPQKSRVALLSSIIEGVYGIERQVTFWNTSYSLVLRKSLLTLVAHAETRNRGLTHFKTIICVTPWIIRKQWVRTILFWISS